jgi:hypothetical protein
VSEAPPEKKRCDIYAFAGKTQDRFPGNDHRRIPRSLSTL